MLEIPDPAKAPDKPNPAPDAAAKTETTPTISTPATATIEVDGQKLTPEQLAQNYSELRKKFTQTAQEKAELEKRTTELEAGSKASSDLANRIVEAARGEPKPVPLTDVDLWLSGTPDGTAALAKELAGPNFATVIQKIAAGASGKVAVEIKTEIAKIRQEREDERKAAEANSKAEFDSRLAAAKSTLKAQHPELDDEMLDRADYLFTQAREKPSAALGGKKPSELTYQGIVEGLLNHYAEKGKAVQDARLKAQEQRRNDDLTIIGPGATPIPGMKEIADMPTGTAAEVRARNARIRELEEERERTGQNVRPA